MQFKRLTQLTPLIMGLIAGLIVAGSIIAIMGETPTLRGKVELTVDPPTNSESEAELGIKFLKKDGNGNEEEITEVDFGELTKDERATQTVIIENTSDVKTVVTALNVNYSSEEIRSNGQSSDENGLDYYYGIKRLENRPEELKGEVHLDHPFLTILKDGERKEIEIFVGFPNQSTAETNKTITDTVDFGYQFYLSRYNSYF